MARQQNRPRRPASNGKLRALRVMGWRYSSTREAWVHRAFSGRIGPVYIDPEYYNHPGVTETVEFDTARPFRPLVVSLSAEERPELPKRVQDHQPVVRRDRTKVRHQLSDTEETRVVVVDGKPPRRGTDPAEMRTADAVVVPIKSARATG